VVHEELLRRRAAVPESSHHPPPIIVHVEEALGRGHGAAGVLIVPPHDPLAKPVVAVFGGGRLRFREVGADTRQAVPECATRNSKAQANCTNKRINDETIIDDLATTPSCHIPCRFANTQ